MPFGILLLATGALSLIFGSAETSDFWVDALKHWWTDARTKLSHVKRLVIYLDNGPKNSGSRTQFLKRMVQFADWSGLEIRLVYYPPYHSKYNLIERCWGILEQHWNGALLSTIETALSWAATMTWKGVRPLIHLLDDVYERGVKLTEIEFRPFAERLLRSEKLPKWSLTIKSKTR